MTPSEIHDYHVPRIPRIRAAKKSLAGVKEGMFRDSQRLFAFRQEEANLIADICGAQAGGQQPNLFEVIFLTTREAMIILVPIKRASSLAVAKAMILALAWDVATHPCFRPTRALVGWTKGVEQRYSLIVPVFSPNLTRLRGLRDVLEITVERSALFVKPVPRRR